MRTHILSFPLRARWSLYSFLTSRAQLYKCTRVHAVGRILIASLSRPRERH